MTLHKEMLVMFLIVAVLLIAVLLLPGAHHARFEP